MVQAILAGQKTTTRRIVKGASADWSYETIGEDCAITAIDRYGMEYPKDVPGLWATFEDPDGCIEFPMIKAPCQRSDVLYVRETWNGLRTGNEKFRFSTQYWYRADGHNENPDDKWRPSIHMPKEAARIFLKVKDVRVEKLQDITNAGAIDEGMLSYHGWETADYRAAVKAAKLYGHKPPLGMTPLQRFAQLWDTTVKSDKDKWFGNPWVWVIEFERIRKEAAK